MEFADLAAPSIRYSWNQSQLRAFRVFGCSRAGGSLSGLKPRVLIVEDEPFIAMMLEEHLLDAGCEVAGTAPNLEKGLALAGSTEMDLAILDMILGSQPSFPVADILAARGIPFMFASGFGSNSLPEEHRGQLVLNKPFHYPDLVKSLKLALGSRFTLEPSV